MKWFLIILAIVIFLLFPSISSAQDEPASISQSITWLQEARNSHWYYVLLPPSPERAKISGDKQFHREWMRRYDKIIGTLQRIQSKYGEEAGQ